MPAPIAAGPSALQVSAAAKAAVAAQAIEENASAKVAMRDEVCRRRNWLRLACARKQSCTKVAAAAEARTPRPHTKAANGEFKRQRQHHRREDQSDGADHRLDLGAHDTRCRDRRGGDEVGRVLARDGEPGEAAGELAGRHHQHRHQHDEAPVPSPKAAPQQQRRRQQIEDLHQRLRHQPGIAPQQRPFLAPQHARRRARGGSRCAGGAGARRACRDAGGGHGVLAEAARRTARSRRRAARSRSPSTPASAGRSPSTARAGHQKRLSTSGATRQQRRDCRTAKRDSVP